jgi:microcin C transport system permease protein
LQQAIVAVVFFLCFTLIIGITTGGILGYFGGWVDLLGQRIIEIWQNLPYLFIVIIIASLIQPSLLILVLVIAAFTWMQPTIYMRTAAYREKARDYVAAARLIGAGPARVIFRHVMPNAIATIVTLAPFLAAGVITSLAALDFLGFGLPPEDPSWGRLLHEGADNFNYPWIVSAAFAALASCLILITFVGEAVREAFDPKKFTTYQ